MEGVGEAVEGERDEFVAALRQSLQEEERMRQWIFDNVEKVTRTDLSPRRQRRGRKGSRLSKIAGEPYSCSAVCRAAHFALCSDLCLPVPTAL